MTTPPLILIVDDDRTMRRLLRVAMEEEGYEVIEAQNGQQCLDEYQSRQPDMVLLDAIMPGMDGFTCCQTLRSQYENSDLPILMITALDDQESIEQAFVAGATDYVTKPIYWSVLSQRVRHLLHTSHALKQLSTLNVCLNRYEQWQQAWGKVTSECQQPFGMKSLLQKTMKDLQVLLGAERVGIHQINGTLLAEVICSGYPSVKTLSWKQLLLWDSYEEFYRQGKMITIDLAQETRLSPDAITPLHQLMVKTVTMMPIVVEGGVWAILWIHHCRQTYGWESLEIECLTHWSDLLAIARRLHSSI